MDRLNKQLLNILQVGFPLTTRPFETIALQLGITPEEVLNRIINWKRKSLIRYIGPIFDSSMLGYQSTLAAFKVEENRVDRVAELLNSHPGISHNYLRSGPVNLWFTLTAKKSKNLKKELERLAKKSKVEKWYFFPAVTVYKIGFRLDLISPCGTDKEPSSIDEKRAEHFRFKVDWRFVRVLQDDMALSLRPYSRAAQILGVSESCIVAQLKKYIAAGIIRRIAAVLNPSKAGFSANVMIAWAPHDDFQKNKLGVLAASQKLISHCYERQTYPDWPYSIYTMVHGKTMDDCRNVAKWLSHESGVNDYTELVTLKEYKKVRMRYFQ